MTLTYLTILLLLLFVSLPICNGVLCLQDDMCFREHLFCYFLLYCAQLTNTDSMSDIIREYIGQVKSVKCAS